VRTHVAADQSRDRGRSIDLQLAAGSEEIARTADRDDGLYVAAGHEAGQGSQMAAGRLYPDADVVGVEG